LLCAEDWFIVAAVQVLLFYEMEGQKDRNAEQWRLLAWGLYIQRAVCQDPGLHIQEQLGSYLKGGTDDQHVRYVMSGFVHEATCVQ